MLGDILLFLFNNHAVYVLTLMISVISFVTLYSRYYVYL